MSIPNVRSRNFWLEAIDAFFKGNPRLYSPHNKALLEKNFLNLIDNYKPVVENLVNICITTVDVSNVIKFVWFSQKIGFTQNNLVTIFRHIAGLGNDGRLFINSVGSKLLGIEKVALKIGKASSVFLIFTVAIQMLIYIRRGEYGLALGEMIKTIIALGCLPAAIFDMFDQLLMTFAPDFMKHPCVRVFRVLNVLQGAKYLADMFMSFGMIFAYAYTHQIREVEKAVTDLATHWEKSPFGIATEASRNVIDLLVPYLPKGYVPNWMLNLVEYNRTHLPDWQKYSG